MDCQLQFIESFYKERSAAFDKFYECEKQKICQCALESALRIAAGGKLIVYGAAWDNPAINAVRSMFRGAFLERPPIPVLVLDQQPVYGGGFSGDTSIFGFIRQLESLAREGDIFLIFSESDDGKFLIPILEAGKSNHLYTILVGQNHCAQYSKDYDLLLRLPEAPFYLAREIQLSFAHLYCQLLDYFLFVNPSWLAKAMYQISD